MRSADFEGTLVLETLDELQMVWTLPPNLVKGLRIKTHNPEVKNALRAGPNYGKKKIVASEVLRSNSPVEVAPNIQNGILEPTYSQKDMPPTTKVVEDSSKKLSEIRARLESGKKASITLPSIQTMPVDVLEKVLSLSDAYPTLLTFSDESVERLVALTRMSGSEFPENLSSSRFQLSSRLSNNAQLHKLIVADESARGFTPISNPVLRVVTPGSDEITGRNRVMPEPTAELRSEETKQESGLFGKFKQKVFSGTSSLVKSGWGLLSRRK